MAVVWLPVLWRKGPRHRCPDRCRIDAGERPERPSERRQARAGPRRLCEALLGPLSVPDNLITIAFQQAIEGQPPRNGEAVALLDHVSRIHHAIKQRPDLRDKVGLDPEAIVEWTEEGSSAAARRL